VWECLSSTAVFEVFIRVISTFNLTVAKLFLADALTIVALEFALSTRGSVSGVAARFVVVKVLGGEWHPFVVSDLEFPRGHAIAAEIGTEHLEDVITLVEDNLEVKSLIITTAPETGLLSNDDLSVHLNNTSLTEIGRKLEGVLSVTLAHWELDTVVVSNVLLNTLAESLVAHSLHVLNISFTVAFGWLLDNLFLELVDHSHDLLLIGPLESLDEHSGFLKWFWVGDGALLLVVDISVLMLAEAADTEDFIGTIITIDATVAVIVLVDALATGTGELGGIVALRVGKEGTLLILVESVVLLEAAHGSSLIGAIRALGFTVTELSVIDAFTGSALELILSAACILWLW
jgi:hypothetical protein